MNTAVSPVVADRDRHDDLRVLLLTAGALMLTFAIGSTVQAIFVFRPIRLTIGEVIEQDPLLPARLFAGVAAVGFVLAAAVLVRLNERRPVPMLAWVAAISVLAGIGRHLLQLLFGVYPRPSLETTTTEVVSACAVVVVSLLLALLQVRTRAQLRQHERAAAEHRTRASLALAELAAEEMRVRREVAEGLHGTLQGRLVMAQSSLTALARRGREAGWAKSDVGRLEELRTELETVREHDVRELSQLLYPVGIDIGLGHAVRTLARRVPADIDITADVAPDADDALDGSTSRAVSARIALVRAVEEAITNALRHGAATTIRVLIRLDEATAGRIRLTVDDDGTGLPATPRWNGLARTADRLELHGGTVALEDSPLGGARLRVELPARPGVR